MPFTDIYHFTRVADDLATAGQPSEQQLEEIAAQGFEVVINLGLLDPRYCLDDEAGLVQSLGMDYIHIPVNFQAPSQDDLQAFFRAMDEAEGKKRFVHCAANYRVSSFVSLYGQARLGWSREQAEEHIRKLWEPDEIWRGFINECREELKPGN